MFISNIVCIVVFAQNSDRRQKVLEWLCTLLWRGLTLVSMLRRLNSTMCRQLQPRFEI
jgi:hypothetical protein